MMKTFYYRHAFDDAVNFIVENKLSAIPIGYISEASASIHVHGERSIKAFEVFIKNKEGWSSEWIDGPDEELTITTEVDGKPMTFKVPASLLRGSNQ